MTQPYALKKRHQGGALRRATRRSARFGVGMLGGTLALGAAVAFLLWDADWWVLRDKYEQFRAALYGDYILPKCREDPESCKPQSPAVVPPGNFGKMGQEPCSDRPGLSLHCRMHVLYDFFNGRLFDKRLPGAVITLQRKRGAVGYYAHKRFRGADGKAMDEIALNPRWFKTVTMLRLTSTLVHEMCHQKIAHFGTPSKNGYHSMAWARCMLNVGLQPSTTGLPGGRMTGKRVTHFVKTGGRFEQLAKAHALIGDKPVDLVEP